MEAHFRYVLALSICGCLLNIFETDDIFIYLQACRVSYNDFVHYHNFRHVVDVLQAVFHFLVQLGTLSPYPENSSISNTPPAVATILEPFDALVLLVSAVGHDVGHPGVNNAFLVLLNAPLAQLYNDRSVLESFHCAAYSQILRRHWPSVFKDTKMRRLMINSILATDMGLHFKYMGDLSKLQEVLSTDSQVVKSWNDKSREEYRDLLCGLLIKCADISNVVSIHRIDSNYMSTANCLQARVFPVAHQWANILTDEFANQGTMEDELGIPTCLFGGPPTPGDIIKLGESQQGFMSVFARPLFDGVASVMPPMSYTVDELERNRQLWEKKIADEKLEPACDSGNVANCTSSTSRGSYAESNPTNENTTPHTSADVADLRSQSVSSSSNWQQTNVSPPQITATALPLQQIEENMSANNADTDTRGRSATTNGTSTNNGTLSSQSDSLLQKASGQNNEKQRAVSAHHSPRQQVDSEPLPNGITPRFGASETDVRYLGNGGSALHGTVKSGKKGLYLQTNGDEGPVSDRNGRIDRRLTQSFKRLWKRRWRPGTNPSHSKADESTRSNSQQANAVPVELQHRSG
jgi:3'5'-cyclic nucleotide phosphodiesterase